MGNSILGSVRKMMGGLDVMEGDQYPFDQELIIHINSVFTILNQLGVGPKTAFFITGESETWEDFFGDEKVVNLAKSYLYLKTKILFDPPQSGVLHEAMERQIQEFEWRLNVETDDTTEVAEDESEEEGG